MEICNRNLRSINEPDCLPANCRSVGINSGNSAYHLKYRHILPPPLNVSIISIPAIRSDIQRPRASNSLAATHVARQNCRFVALSPERIVEVCPVFLLSVLTGATVSPDEKVRLTRRCAVLSEKYTENVMRGMDVAFLLSKRII